MVFSACQLTKEPRVVHGQTEEPTYVCLSKQLSVWMYLRGLEWVEGECVEDEAWHLSGWGAYENIGSRPGTNLYLSYVSSGDWQSNTQDAPLLSLKKTKVMILPCCCYILGWFSWTGYILWELRYIVAEISPNLEK